MFVTATLPSYGAVLANGAPRHPTHYDHRRAALDALHFSKLCGRLWTNLRRAAGYRVQYFSAIEAQRRLAPHLHAAARGAIPRAVLRQVVDATYYQLWWPFDQAVYVDRLPEWTGPEHGYADPDTGVILPTWGGEDRPLVPSLDPADWTPRELRHSLVSLLSDAGMSIEDISRLVGHSGTNVTELVYRHQIRPVIQTGATIMDRLFGQGGSGA